MIQLIAAALVLNLVGISVARPVESFWNDVGEFAVEGTMDFQEIAEAGVAAWEYRRTIHRRGDRNDRREIATERVLQ
jgi:hypothetical protein